MPTLARRGRGRVVPPVRPASPIPYVTHPFFNRADAREAVEALRPADRNSGADQPQPTAAGGAIRSGHRRVEVALDAPLLSRADERFLFVRMNYLRFRAAELQRKIDRGDAPRGLTERVEALLAESIELRNQIAVANLRLVVSIASTFASKQHPLDELFSECQASLLRAVELYDVEQGYSFSTYATHAVRNALGRSLEQRQRHARRMPPAERGLLACVPDGRAPHGAVEKGDSRRRALVARYLSLLPDRDRRIIAARFGLDGSDRERTFREVGRLFGISKERARVLANRAMLQLQEAARIGEDEAVDD